MKHKLLRLAHLLFLVACAAALAAAQTNEDKNAPPSTAAQSSAATQSTNRTSADETFEVNITERRITERDYAASTLDKAGKVLNEKTVSNVSSLSVLSETTNTAGQVLRRVTDTSGAVIELTLDAAGKVINSRVVSQATNK
ncbi:MAG TPA: hypothetical protein VF658_15260 [Pyrinomonadaceae bacterium]|jgi:hypothetical protein